jgi:hypothetical protein
MENIKPLPFGQKVLRTWWLSVTDIAFYRLAVHLSSRFVWSYVLVSYALLATLSTLFFAVRTLPQLEQQAFTTADKVVAQLPNNFAFRYQDYQLTASPSALTLNYPDNTEATPSEHLIALDTTVDAPASPTALLSFGRQQLKINTNGTIQTFSYQEIFGVDTYSFTKSDWPTVRLQWQTEWKQATPTLIMGFWLTSWLGVLALRLLFLIIYAWLGQSWLRWHWRPAPNYAETYRVGLLLLIVAEALARLIHMLYPDNNWIGLWIIWLILWLCVGYFTRHLGRVEK